MSKTIGHEFMRQTRLPTQEVPPQRQGAARPPLELPCPADAHLIPLPAAAEIDLPPLDVRAAIQNRRTWRKYGPQSLSLDELAFLLWATQGVKSVTERQVVFRTVPSAGARHAFETFVLVNRVETLTPGLYRYLALRNALMEVDLAAGIAARLTAACYDQEQVLHSTVSFFWVAVSDRMAFRYGQRGYRYLHLDAGHVCQNLYLAAEVIGCGVCAIAAFKDDELNAVLGLDGEALFAIYAASLGKKETG